MDLISTLPTFSLRRYTHILPSLERKLITTVDLITLDALEIAKRAQVPPADVRRLRAEVIEALHHDLGFREEGEGGRGAEVDQRRERRKDDALRNQDQHLQGEDQVAFSGEMQTRKYRINISSWLTISLLDPAIDALLDGGIPTGYLTEVTGESGSGKTQFLLNLLLTVQLPRPRGLGKRAIFLSTESPLPTTRLSQILESHPYLSTLTGEDKPSLENILSTTAVDLETQDHILSYQLPVAITRYNVGLVVVDSITANYRAEHTSHTVGGLSTRSRELARVGQLLRNLAVRENIAVVVANQVSDRFEPPVQDEHSKLFRSPLATGAAMRLDSNVSLPGLKHKGNDGPLEPIAVLGSSRENLLFPSSSPALSQPFLEQSEAISAAAIDSDGSYLVGQDPIRSELLSLTHQQRFFTGWGDSPLRPFSLTETMESPKTPALGLVWSTQISCRIVLKKGKLSSSISSAIVAAPFASTPPPPPTIASASNGIVSTVGRHQRTSSVTVTAPQSSSHIPGASGLGPEELAEPDVETVLDEQSINADGNARETDTNLNSGIEVDVVDIDRIDVDGQEQERQRYFALPALTNTDHPHRSIRNLTPQGSTALPTTSENDIHRLPLPLSSASPAGMPRQISTPPAVTITESMAGPKMMGTSAKTTFSTTITKRHMKLVFAPWAGGTHKRTWTDHDGNEIKIVGDEVEYEIWGGGIRSL